MLDQFAGQALVGLLQRPSAEILLGRPDRAAVLGRMSYEIAFGLLDERRSVIGYDPRVIPDSDVIPVQAPDAESDAELTPALALARAAND